MLAIGRALMSTKLFIIGWTKSWISKISWSNCRVNYRNKLAGVTVLLVECKHGIKRQAGYIMKQEI